MSGAKHTYYRYQRSYLCVPIFERITIVESFPQFSQMPSPRSILANICDQPIRVTVRC